MATLSNSFAGWVSPYQNGTDETTLKIFQSLSQFLNNPNFPGGATVNGHNVLAALGSGLLIQSGQSTTVTFTTGNGTLTYPTAFPNSIICCVVMPAMSTNFGFVNRSAGPTTTNVPLRYTLGAGTAYSGNANLDWIAVGT